MDKRTTHWMLVVSGKKKRQNSTNCIANKYDNEILYFFVHFFFFVVETFSLKGQQKLYISII